MFLDRVGLTFPTIEVRYEHLNIVAETYVGDRGLPSFFNSTLNAIEVLQIFLIYTVYLQVLIKILYFP